jgi:isopentenyl-diphosphate delta-isomerase
MDLAWAGPADLTTAARATPWAFSPWMVEQLELLAVVAPEFASGRETGSDGDVGRSLDTAALVLERQP